MQLSAKQIIAKDSKALPRPPRIDLDDYLPYLVNRLGAALSARFAKETLAPRGLSIEMWRVLAVLSSQGAHRHADLASMTSIDISTLSRMVSRLVRLGLVVRTPSANDSRAVTVSLTAKGTAAVTTLIPIALAYERAAKAGIPARDLAALKRALRRMHANLNPASRKQDAAG
jgi:DNA-binding MarR family transcriptional regulator